MKLNDITAENNNENINEYQKEYEAYIKQVTDAFVDMQSDKIEGTIGHYKDVVYYEVIWNGGLDYEFDLNFGLYLIGIDLAEMRKHNASIAKQYLIENICSYDDWMKKFKS